MRALLSGAADPAMLGEACRLFSRRLTPLAAFGGALAAPATATCLTAAGLVGHLDPALNVCVANASGGSLAVANSAGALNRTTAHAQNGSLAVGNTFGALNTTNVIAAN